MTHNCTGLRPNTSISEEWASCEKVNYQQANPSLLHSAVHRWVQVNNTSLTYRVQLTELWETEVRACGSFAWHQTHKIICDKQLANRERDPLANAKWRLLFVIFFGCMWHFSPLLSTFQGNFLIYPVQGYSDRNMTSILLAMFSCEWDWSTLLYCRLYSPADLMTMDVGRGFNKLWTWHQRFEIAREKFLQPFQHSLGKQSMLTIAVLTSTVCIAQFWDTSQRAGML